MDDEFKRWPTRAFTLETINNTEETDVKWVGKNETVAVGTLELKEPKAIYSGGASR